MYLSLCIVIIRNNVYSIYSSFLENIKLFYILLGVFSNACIEILADSKLCKCLKAIKYSESREEALQILFILTLRFLVTQMSSKFLQLWLQHLCIRQRTPYVEYNTIIAAAIITEIRSFYLSQFLLWVL